MSTTIGIDSLSKTYRTREGITRAVDRVSLSIEPGELFFLLGPSGCGKTTLLRMIAGFIDPTEGRLLFDSLDVTHMPANRRDTGMVFQSYALWPHMTVAQNVGFGLDVRKVPGAEKAGRVAGALEAVQMGHLADRKPTQLSGGQQQRVALARALVVRPRVLLLDEPLSNLDAKLRIELRAEIRRICKDAGMTTVYVTHDQKEALSMADRIAIMRDGQIKQIGTPEELYRRPTTAFVASFLGETNLLPATVETSSPGLARLRVPGGLIEAKLPPTALLERDARITCSIRPESWAIMQEPSNVSAELVSTTYLGEVSQHLFRVDGHELHVAELNPREVARNRPGARLSLKVDPIDVAVLAGE
ncbi:MAG: ABC transporter ATP-binding protein [Leptolyngbya sp. PLA3]|nr:MAG: ABC transporter ATP-binding protein [Cyanobacteria bacterium CYA]MCE7967469.1 ABC transporter ATP-binding protein [Leptolyngbya sp. PL-A3]